jgi:predicted nucleic acid-binding protein
MRAVYLDTSAAVKLFKAEPESAPLGQWLSALGSALVLTCDLTRCELRRALHTAKIGPAAREEAESWLADCALIRLTPALCDQAGALCPGAPLRSLDALHTAAALSLGSALVAFAAYDKSLLDAAEKAGLTVVSPG